MPGQPSALCKSKIREDPQGKEGPGAVGRGRPRPSSDLRNGRRGKCLQRKRGRKGKSTAEEAV